MATQDTEFRLKTIDTERQSGLEEKSDEQPLAIVPPQDTVPDGGLRAWCTVIGGWLALFATFGYASSFGVYQDFYTRAHLASSSNISWIGSVQLFFFVAMGLPAGRLLDQGHFRPVMLIGSLIYLFSMFMLSLAHPDRYYQIFLSQGVGMGIGSGLIYLPAMAVQAHHWQKRRSLAMGVVITGSSVGGIIYPIMLNHLFSNPSVGFAWGVRASAFLTLGILVIANLLMSARLPGNKDRPDGPKPNPREIMADAPFMMAVIGGFFVIWGLFFPYFYLQSFTVLKGMDTNFAFYTLTIQNGASIFGRTVPNYLADKIGPVNVITFVSFATGVLVFALFGVTDVGGVVVFAVLYGFFSGAVLSLFAPSIASFSRDVPEVGVRMGIAYFITSFAFLSGTPVDGALLQDGFPWWKPIVFSGTIILFGIPILVMARTMQARRKGTQRV